VVRPSGDGRRWSTIAPAGNARIAEYTRELLTELWQD
jgi:ESX secretion-associated protein EspG